MQIIAGIAGALLILIMLEDAFETIVLPRTVTRRLRLARLFYRFTWQLWALIGRGFRRSSRRDFYLSLYGPLSLLMLLVIWALGIVVGFALLQWALGSHFSAPEKQVTFGTTLYMSGTTFFTLGLGDVTPDTALARLVTVAEAGMGFGFLALVISYLPVLYQGFSRREASISRLDARAGSPPSVTEMLRRHIVNPHEDEQELINALHDWETWAAELMESHLSYPVLMYYRSQHERQSWLATLTVILDTCALISVLFDGATSRAAWFTFAMSRHAAVDLSQLLFIHPRGAPPNRLPPEDLARLRQELSEAGFQLPDEREFERRLQHLRSKYEPYVYGISRRLQMPLPRWVPEQDALDDWQTSAWDHSVTASLAALEDRKMLRSRL